MAERHHEEVPMGALRHRWLQPFEFELHRAFAGTLLDRSPCRDELDRLEERQVLVILRQRGEHIDWLDTSDVVVLAGEVLVEHLSGQALIIAVDAEVVKLVSRPRRVHGALHRGALPCLAAEFQVQVRVGSPASPDVPIGVREVLAANRRDAQHTDGRLENAEGHVRRRDLEVREWDGQVVGRDQLRCQRLVDTTANALPQGEHEHRVHCAGKLVAYLRRVQEVDVDSSDDREGADERRHFDDDEPAHRELVDAHPHARDRDCGIGARVQLDVQLHAHTIGNLKHGDVIDLRRVIAE
mmetsp:Transcript_79258/g.230149  ORF Transcript_79258/g.230149 Transcript_79258/m.230149 type:complete len:297 (+) Transcript_79258:797-1687(+)